MNFICQACKAETGNLSGSYQQPGITHYTCPHCSALFAYAGPMNGFPTLDGSGWLKLVSFGSVHPENAHINIRIENFTQLDVCPHCSGRLQIEGRMISDDIFQLNVKKPEISVVKVWNRAVTPNDNI